MTIQVDILYNAPDWQTTNWHAQGANFNIQAVINTAVYACVSEFKADNYEISVVLTNNSFIQQLNQQYRHKNSPTNVLSFPARDKYMVGDMVENLGDVIIAFETVMQEAKQQQKPAIDHFVHLVVHGTLHVLGLDHQTALEAEKMEGLERRILKKLGISDPYASMDIIG